MLANYGYKDGSGEYFITIDTERCTVCGDCVEVCPAHVLEMVEDEFSLDDEMVAVVREEHRKKLKYSCAPCKPTSGQVDLPCVLACEPEAIAHSW